MKKILVTTPSFCRVSDAPLKMLEDAGFEVVWIKGATQDEIKRNIVDADAVINAVEPLMRDVLEVAQKLKVISHHGVGLDNVDVAYAKERGIEVFNTKGCNTEAVADHAFLLAMAAARRLNEAQNDVNTCHWQKPVGTKVWGATMGIIGMGAIGKAVARRARGFNMTVLGNDIYWDEKFAAENNVRRATLEEIYRECDFISIHCNLTDENRGMIGMEQFKMMKKTAVLVNAARGPIVNEKDLYTAVKNGIIFAAGLDVFEVEPTPADNPLLSLPRIVRTPHSAQYDADCLNRVSTMAVENVLKAIQ